MPKGKLLLKVFPFSLAVADADVPPGEHIVEGYVTAEVVDSEGDLIPFEEAVRAFEEFVRERGGVVREMHQLRAVGKVEEWRPDQENRRIWVRVRLSQTSDGEEAWQKIREGILRGFSIAGRAMQVDQTEIEGRKADVLKRITIHELSLVDVPANPEAVITMVKALKARLAEEDLPPDSTHPPRVDLDRLDFDFIRASLFPDESADPWGDDDEALWSLYVKRMTDEEKEKIEEMLRERGKKAGIARKEGEPLTPPKGYPKDPRQYADPANWSWPVDTKARARAALAYYNAGKGKELYSDAEWKRLGERIAEMAGEKLGAKYVLHQGKIRRKEDVEKAIQMAVAPVLAQILQKVEEVAKMVGNEFEKKDLQSLLSAAKTVLDEAAQGASVVSLEDAVRQVAQVLEVAVDYVRDLEEKAEAETATTATKAEGGKEEPIARLRQLIREVADEVEKARRATPTRTPARMEEETETSPASPTRTEEETETSPASPTTPSPLKTPTGVEKAEEPVRKAEEPVAFRTPEVFIKMEGVDPAALSYAEAAFRMDFRKAYEIARYDRDEAARLANIAARAILKQAGIHRDALDAFWATYANRDILIDPYIAGTHFEKVWNGEFAKALTSAQAPGIYLVRLIRILLPLYNFIAREIPRNVPERGGKTAIWRAATKVSNWSSVILSAIQAAEPGVGPSVDTDFAEFQAPFSQIAVNDAVSLLATNTMRGYDDPFQAAMIRAFTAALESEERKILGDNYAPISGPATVTATANAGGSLAGGNYTVRVTALTYIGYLAGSQGGASAVGESTATASSAVSVDGTTNKSVKVYWDPVPGAVAYNVYLDNGTVTRYVATCPYAPNATNAIIISALPASGNPPPSANTTDRSVATPPGFEGLISWAERSTIYGNSISQKLAPISMGGATSLTGYAGGIQEIDNILEDLWSRFQAAPSLLVASPKLIRHISKLLLDLSKPQYYVMINAERGGVVGGAIVTAYVNKFAAFGDGLNPMVKLVAHPYMPPGKILLLSETVPYPTAREARAFTLEVLQPWLFFPLARTQAQFPFSIHAFETLACHFPMGQAAITDLNVVTP